jgi:hypothetical protein
MDNNKWNIKKMNETFFELHLNFLTIKVQLIKHAHTFQTLIGRIVNIYLWTVVCHMS